MNIGQLYINPLAIAIAALAVALVVALFGNNLLLRIRGELQGRRASVEWVWGKGGVSVILRAPKAYVIKEAGLVRKGQTEIVVPCRDARNTDLQPEKITVVPFGGNETIGWAYQNHLSLSSWQFEIRTTAGKVFRSRVPDDWLKAEDTTAPAPVLNPDEIIISTETAHSFPAIVAAYIAFLGDRPKWGGNDSGRSHRVQTLKSIQADVTLRKVIRREYHDAVVSACNAVLQDAASHDPDVIAAAASIRDLMQGR